MHFILQLFHAPAVRTVPEARAFVAGRHEVSANQRARLHSFAESLATAQPALSASAKVQEAIFAIKLPELPTPQVVVPLARVAASAGLHLLDRRNEMLYRADGCLVHANGSVTPMPLLPAAPPPEPPAPPPPPPLPTREAARARAAQRLGEQLAPHGYHAAAGHMLVRRSGAVKQGIGLAAGERAGVLVMQPVFAFHCHDVSQVWHDALGLAAASATPDVTLRAGELAAGEAPPTDAITIRSTQDVDRWVSAFVSWLTGTALPQLDKVQRAADLGALALSDGQLKLLSRRRDLAPSERFSRLVLAAAFDADRLPAWTEALRGSPPSGSPAPPPGDHHSMDRLVAFLQA